MLILIFYCNFLNRITNFILQVDVEIRYVFEVKFRKIQLLRNKQHRAVIYGSTYSCALIKTQNILCNSQKTSSVEKVRLKVNAVRYFSKRADSLQHENEKRFFDRLLFRLP